MLCYCLDLFGKFDGGEFFLVDYLCIVGLDYVVGVGGLVVVGGDW